MSVVRSCSGGCVDARGERDRGSEGPDRSAASGNGKGQIFIRGEVVETVPEDQIVETLIRRANALAEELGLEPGSGSVEVSPITAPEVKLPGIDF